MIRDVQGFRSGRRHIHAILDPLWRDGGKWTRSALYSEISKRIGREYHTAEIRSVEEAREVV